jgi:hypothetical protein
MKIGIHSADAAAVEAWIPAFAGMTAEGMGDLFRGSEVRKFTVGFR